ncbi:hypothetical protein BGW41_003838, partial [Actinomortierella wolfii]
TSTIITGVIAPLSALQRARPQYIPRILKTLTSFIRNGSLPSQLTPLQIRFIDKAIRIQLVTVSKLRLQADSPQYQALTEALGLYGITYNGVGLGKSQLHQLLHVDKDGDDSRRTSKRARASNHEATDADFKRVKTEPAAPPAPSATIPPGFGISLLSQVNITQMPLHHVVDIIFETLAANTPPQLFHSFMTALPIMPHQPGPLPPPPPGATLPPPPPPPAIGASGQDTKARGQDKATPPQTPSASVQTPAGTPQIKQEPTIKQEPGQPRIPSGPPSNGPPPGKQIKVIVLPPQHTPVRLPPRPVIAKSDAVVLAARKKEPTEEVKKEEPGVSQQQLKKETFQVAPFVPTGREAVAAERSPLRDVLETIFMRILAAEKYVTVPAATGRNFFEAAAASGRLALPSANAQRGDEGSSSVALYSSSTGESQSKVVTKADWMTLTTRILTRAFNRKSEEEPSSSTSTSTMTSSQRAEHLKMMMVKHICSDFRKYRELALTWLHEEWYFDKENLKKMEDGDPSVPVDWEPQYLWCLYKLLDGIISGTTGTDAPRDRGFIRFLLEVPELPDDAVDMIKRYCEEPPRAQLGFTCLRDIINLRPPSRARALSILLGYTSNSDKALRLLAIMTARKWYMEHDTLGPIVEAHAVAQLDALKTFEVPKRDHPAPAPKATTDQEQHATASTLSTDVQMKDATMEAPVAQREASTEPRPPAANASSTDGANTTTAAPPAKVPIDDKFATKVVKAEEDIGNQLEFYFSLCAKNNGLLIEVLQRYQSLDPFVQRVVRQKIVPLIKWVKSDSAKLLTLIREFPAGAENLILRIIHIMTEAGRPSRSLVLAVQETVVSHDLNARFIVPIVSGMQKDEVIACLPRIVNLLKGGAERDRKMVEDVFLSLLAGSKGRPAATTQQGAPGQQQQQLQRSGAAGSAPGGSSGQGGASTNQFGPLLTPSELLVELHKIENVVGWKIACEAMDICFAHPEIYRSEVLAVILQQLLDQPTIPALFMRTVIQAITMYKNLVGFANSMVLSPLVQKKIWTVPVLWKGFIRCAKLMSPTSSSVLATLPKPQLKDVYAAEPSLKEPVEAYVKARSSGRRVGGGVTKQLNLHHVATSPASATAPPTDDAKQTEKPSGEVDGSKTATKDAKDDLNKETGDTATIGTNADKESDSQPAKMDVDDAPPAARTAVDRIEGSRDDQEQEQHQHQHQKEEENERIENVGV